VRTTSTHPHPLLPQDASEEKRQLENHEVFLSRFIESVKRGDHVEAERIMQRYPGMNLNYVGPLTGWTALHFVAARFKKYPPDCMFVKALLTPGPPGSVELDVNHTTKVDTGLTLALRSACTGVPCAGVLAIVTMMLGHPEFDPTQEVSHAGEVSHSALEILRQYIYSFSRERSVVRRELTMIAVMLLGVGALPVPQATTYNLLVAPLNIFGFRQHDEFQRRAVLNQRGHVVWNNILTHGALIRLKVIEFTESHSLLVNKVIARIGAGADVEAIICAYISNSHADNLRRVGALHYDIT
jgi:hypothetical protein